MSLVAPRCIKSLNFNYLWLSAALLACDRPPSIELATSGAQSLPAGEALASSSASPPPPRRRPETGRWGERWCFGAGAPMSGSPAVGPEGEVYVATHEGYVHALTERGTFQWSYTLKGGAVGSPVLQPDGSLVVGTSLNLLYALRPDGTRSWVFRVPERLSSPLISSDRGTLVFAAARRTVYAVSKHGGVLWRVVLPADATTPPGIHENSTVFIGTDQGVYHWQSPARRALWPSPPVDRFVVEERGAQGAPKWLASGHLFSSNGRVDSLASIAFARRLASGETLAVTNSRLLLLGPDGKQQRALPLPVEPSGAPLPGNSGDFLVPAADGTVVRIDASGSSEIYARLGFSPVSELIPDRGRQRFVASVGEGQVCAVSLSRRSTGRRSEADRVR